MPEQASSIPATLSEAPVWLAGLGSTFALHIWKLLWPELPNMTKAVRQELFGDWGKVDPQTWRNMLGWFKTANLLSEADVNNLMQMKDIGGPLNLVFFIQMALRLFTSYLTGICDPAVLKLQQAINKLMRPSLPSYSSLIAAAFVAPEKVGEVRDLLARMGFAESDIDLMFIGAYKLYDEFTVRELFWRKILPPDKVYERMRELGYTDTRIKEITEAWQVIPPIPDILTMVGHEAFEPDTIRRVGLDEEFPEEQSEWLEKQGLSRFWQEKYWISHWEQPSIQMGYEMLQRGIIDRTDLEFLFRIVEIPRFWREKLLAIAYTPYTRVDARRMHKLGVLSDEELVTAYKDIGYDQAHAEKMAEFTRRANLGAERDLSKAEVLTGYRERIITREQAETFLRNLHYDEAETGYLLDFQDWKLEQEIQQDLLAAIQARYQGRLIDRSEAQRQLDQLGLPSAQVTALLARWEVKVLGPDRVPSKTDLEDFLRAGIIGSDTYRQEMARLGYASQYIDWYERFALAQGPRFTAKK